jgi:hypothetical protein
MACIPATPSRPAPAGHVSYDLWMTPGQMLRQVGVIVLVILVIITLVISALPIGGVVPY